MTKKLLITLSILTLFASCGTRRTAVQVQDPATFDEGVVINGIRWATRNVDAPGRFAESPESFGMLFLWNSKQGVSLRALLEIEDYYDYLKELERWDCIEELVIYVDKKFAKLEDTDIEGTKWYAENDPCPPGWRVPTQAELQSLTGAISIMDILANETSEPLVNQNDTSVWTTLNGVNGRLFGTAPNQIFLPAAGMLVGGYFYLEFYNEHGFYWSGTECVSDCGIVSAWYLDFTIEHNVMINIFGREFGLPVRCVAK